MAAPCHLKTFSAHNLFCEGRFTFALLHVTVVQNLDHRHMHTE